MFLRHNVLIHVSLSVSSHVHIVGVIYFNNKCFKSHSLFIIDLVARGMNMCFLYNM